MAPTLLTEINPDQTARIRLTGYPVHGHVRALAPGSWRLTLDDQDSGEQELVSTANSLDGSVGVVSRALLRRAQADGVDLSGLITQSD